MPPGHRQHHHLGRPQCRDASLRLVRRLHRPQHRPHRAAQKLPAHPRARIPRRLPVLDPQRRLPRLRQHRKGHQRHPEINILLRRQSAPGSYSSTPPVAVCSARSLTLPTDKHRVHLHRPRDRRLPQARRGGQHVRRHVALRQQGKPAQHQLAGPLDLDQLQGYGLAHYRLHRSQVQAGCLRAVEEVHRKRLGRLSCWDAWLYRTAGGEGGGGRVP